MSFHLCILVIDIFYFVGIFKAQILPTVDILYYKVAIVKKIHFFCEAAMQTTYDTSSLQITMSKNVHFNMFD